MTYLVANAASPSPAAQFRSFIQGKEIVQLPGVHDPLAALQAKGAGFKAAYISGAAISASLGLPDIGLMTSDELCTVVKQIVRVSSLPLLVDGDSGYGETFNAMNLVKALESAGAAAVHIEDQTIPKRCGTWEADTLLEPEKMSRKIAAMVKARRELYVIARTEAAKSEGVRGAIARSKMYLDAGADAVFPTGLTSRLMLEEFVTEIKAPVLAVMADFGKSPRLSAAEFQAMGFKMVIWPVSSLRVAAKAQAELFEALKRNGHTDESLSRMLNREELLGLIQDSEFKHLDASIAAAFSQH